MSRGRPAGADLVLVALGGAAGAVLRWALDAAWSTGDGLPWVTLTINVVGAFALGAMPALEAVRRSHRLALALGPGLLGGFTTVSAWSEQVRGLAADGHTGLAAMHLAGTLAAALLAAHLGRRLAHSPEPEDALT